LKATGGYKGFKGDNVTLEIKAWLQYLRIFSIGVPSRAMVV
jgi:hypothetical protein